MARIRTQGNRAEIIDAFLERKEYPAKQRTNAQGYVPTSQRGDVFLSYMTVVARFVTNCAGEIALAIEPTPRSSYASRTIQGLRLAAVARGTRIIDIDPGFLEVSVTLPPAVVSGPKVEMHVRHLLNEARKEAEAILRARTDWSVAWKAIRCERTLARAGAIVLFLGMDVRVPSLRELSPQAANRLDAIEDASRIDREVREAALALKADIDASRALEASLRATEDDMEHLALLVS